VLCAHDFDGSNSLTVLLASAVRIAQSLGIHRLGPDPGSDSNLEDVLQREIRKSVWMFLATQDWFLIPFSNAYSILPGHFTTPLPSSCNSMAGFGGHIEPFESLPDDRPTDMSFLLALFRVAEVYRTFFDRTMETKGSTESASDLRILYEHVLKADADMRAIAKTTVLLSSGTYDADQFPWLERQRRHFGISLAHKRLTIHHGFFLKSLVDPWYNYTKTACISCARTILSTFNSAPTAEDLSQNLWTITAHVLGASIILLLALLFSDDDSLREEALSTRQLVSESVQLLRSSSKASSLVTRGISLIDLLLHHSQDGGRSSAAFDMKNIAAHLAANPRFGHTAMAESIVQFDAAELDEWIDSMGLTFQ
jgi:hypothetical protein